LQNTNEGRPLHKHAKPRPDGIAGLHWQQHADAKVDRTLSHQQGRTVKNFHPPNDKTNVGFFYKTATNALPASSQTFGIDPRLTWAQQGRNQS
jgi:hypothetical protein